MISKAEWYAFLIIAVVWAVWIGGKLDEIKKELKTLREKMDKK